MWTGNFKSATASLRQAKWRTTFTMMGIIIGITSVVTLVSLGEGLKHRINSQIGQLGGNVITIRPGKIASNSGSLTNLDLTSFLAPSTLTNRDVNSLSQLPTTANVAPIEFVGSSAIGDKGELDNLFVAGTSSNLVNILNQKVAYGDFFSPEDSDQNFAIIGSDIASKLFGLFNPVGETIQINGQDFIVHGVFESSAGSLLSIGQANLNSSVLIPAPQAEALTASHPNILQIFYQAKPGSNINSTVAQINKTIAKNHGGTHDFTVLKQDQLLSVNNQLLDTTTSFVAGIAAISLLVGGIGIMNIMLVSISERTREIGIRKAVGATNRQILNQFLVEGLALSIGGGIIGVLVALGINLFLRLYTSWQPIVSIPIMLLAVGVSVAAGVIFSITPALKAARKDPITALRGE